MPRGSESACQIDAPVAHGRCSLPDLTARYCTAVHVEFLELGSNLLKMPIATKYHSGFWANLAIVNQGSLPPDGRVFILYYCMPILLGNFT